MHARTTFQTAVAAAIVFSGFAGAAGPARAQDAPTGDAARPCPVAFEAQQVTIRQGETARIGLSLPGPGARAIAFSVSSPAAGISGTATPNPLVRRAPRDAALTVFVADDAAPGTHPLVVRCEIDAQGGAAQASTTLMVTVAEAAAGIRWTRVWAGRAHSCAVDEAGAAYCWGRNRSGELGHGEVGARSAKSTPAPVAGSIRFASLSPGFGEFTCGVSTDDEAYCWGRGYVGQLGIGRQSRGEGAPVPVAGRLRWSQVSAGDQHACGIVASGDAYCWGTNTGGALGTGQVGRLNASREPVLVAGEHKWSHIAAGHHFTCGVTAAGELYCWGSNGFGQLGIRGTESHRQPVRAWGDARWTTVTAARDHACGISTDGVASCWGRNHQGQLGIGSTSDRSIPGRVRGDHRWTAIAAADGRTCGVTVEGRAYCWGADRASAAGPRPVVHTEPVAVEGAFTWTSVGAGPEHTCGTAATGSIYCWGRGHGAGHSNAYGRFPLPERVADP